MNIGARLQKLESRTGALLPAVIVVGPDETMPHAMRRYGYPDSAVRLVTQTNLDASRRFVFIQSEFPLEESV